MSIFNFKKIHIKVKFQNAQIGGFAGRIAEKCAFFPFLCVDKLQILK